MCCRRPVPYVYRQFEFRIGFSEIVAASASHARFVCPEINEKALRGKQNLHLIGVGF